LRYCARNNHVSLASKQNGNWQSEHFHSIGFPVSRPCVIIFRFFQADGTRKWEIDSNGGNGPKIYFEHRVHTDPDPECWIKLSQNVTNPVIKVERVGR
jgi:hypothetical protein